MMDGALQRTSPSYRNGCGLRELRGGPKGRVLINERRFPLFGVPAQVVDATQALNRKLLGSRATILAGLSGPRLVPVTCGFADGA